MLWESFLSLVRFIIMGFFKVYFFVFWRGYQISATYNTEIHVNVLLVYLQEIR